MITIAITRSKMDRIFYRIKTQWMCDSIIEQRSEEDRVMSDDYIESVTNDVTRHYTAIKNRLCKHVLKSVAVNVNDSASVSAAIYAYRISWTETEGLFLERLLFQGVAIAEVEITLNPDKLTIETCVRLLDPWFIFMLGEFSVMEDDDDE